MIIENSQKFINEVFHKRFNYEDEVLDYKLMYKFQTDRDKLELVKDIVSFANTEGGFIIYGVKDKNYEWEGIDDESSDINDIQIKSFLNKYVSSEISFKCGTYFIDGKQFYLLTIDKLNNEPISFLQDGTYTKVLKGGKGSVTSYVFHKGDIYGRVGSSSTRVNDDLFFFKRRQNNFNLLTNLHNIKPPYKKYVERLEAEKLLFEALENKNIRYVQINGLGGIGKTSLVWNFCERILSKNLQPNFKINSIIWLTGKMDYFTEDGEIVTLRDISLSFEEVLCEITDVLMMNVNDLSGDELLREIYKKLETYPALFVFDNMETIHDNRIDKFFLNLPNSCRCIFTTRINMSSSHLRIDLTGFNLSEFELYVSNVLEEKRPALKDKLFGNIKPYLNDFLELTCGSPIIMNFILQKICAGFSISKTINGLKTMSVNSDGFINTVMDFCFNEIFTSLTALQKQILYAMSIPESDSEMFEVADLSYIVSASDDNVENALAKINENSFCEFDGKAYSCSMLIRAFINKKMALEEKKIDLFAIEEKYNEWINSKNSFNDRENQFFNKVKAFNFKKKMIVTKLTKYKYDFDKDHDFDKLIDRVEELIRQCPDYGYLYYEKAVFFLSHNLDDEANQLFLEAIKKDPKNDYYLSEYAFYLYKNSRPKESILFFKKSLSINPNLPNVNHGLANAYVKIYTSSKDSGIDPNEILKAFEKGYVSETDTYSSKIKYCKNAGKHASFLSYIGKNKEALRVCDKALKLIPSDSNILATRGMISSRINPDRLSETKINKARTGIFSALSDEDIKKLLEIGEDE